LSKAIVLMRAQTHKGFKGRNMFSSGLRTSGVLLGVHMLF